MIKFFKRMMSTISKIECDVESYSSKLMKSTRNHYELNTKRIITHTTKTSNKNTKDMYESIEGLYDRIAQVTASREKQTRENTNIQEAFSRERWSDICEEMGRVSKKLDMLFVISTNIERKFDDLYADTEEVKEEAE